MCACVCVCLCVCIFCQMHLITSNAHSRTPSLLCSSAQKHSFLCREYTDIWFGATTCLNAYTSSNNSNKRNNTARGKVHLCWLLLLWWPLDCVASAQHSISVVCVCVCVYWKVTNATTISAVLNIDFTLLFSFFALLHSFNVKLPFC